MGKRDVPVALGYVFAQLAGAGVGALPLLGWGAMDHCVAFGTTLLGEGYAMQSVLPGEALIMGALIAGLCVFLGFRACVRSPQHCCRLHQRIERNV
jgi:hypothetical protein